MEQSIESVLAQGVDYCRWEEKGQSEEMIRKHEK